MSLTRIRNRIEALQRRYALPLLIVRLRPFATQFCDQWAVAQDRHQPLPETHSFVIKLADAGFRLSTYMLLHHYIERKRNDNKCPEPRGIINALLPHAAAPGGIIEALFQWDPLPRLRPRSSPLPPVN